jgi:hypothetical protein
MDEDEDTDTDDDISLGNLVILTPDEMLFKGLDLLGWDTSRVEKWKTETAVKLRVLMAKHDDGSGVCVQRTTV